MSIETLLKELNDNLALNNKLLKESNEARAELVKKAGGAVEKPAAEKPARAEKAEKPAPAKAKKAEKPAPAKGKAKAPSDDDVLMAFGNYLDTDDEDAREERKSNVRAILDELGVKKASLIAAEDRAKALGWLEQFEAGKKVNFNEDADEDEPDEDDEDEDDLV